MNCKYFIKESILYLRDLFLWSFDSFFILFSKFQKSNSVVIVRVDNIGDFILSGGEIPALLIINGLTRLLPGTLGDPESLINESHNSSLLEYPQYTRPQVFKDMRVPDVLINGNHKEIEIWRKEQMLKRTIERRKDLLKKRVPNQNGLKYNNEWFWDI